MIVLFICFVRFLSSVNLREVHFWGGETLEIPAIPINSPYPLFLLLSGSKFFSRQRYRTHHGRHSPTSLVVDGEEKGKITVHVLKWSFGMDGFPSAREIG
jgi:hypothetical protein